MKSLLWFGSQNALARVINLIMLVILARLIGPTEIGLVGVALLAMSGLQQFTNFGLNAALIYREEENVDSYLDTVWLLEIARGVLIALCMYAIAPLAASLFGEPRAVPLVRVMGIAPLLASFKNPAIVYFDKNLDFHKEFVYDIGANLIRFVGSVGYALYEPTAWSFVVGYLVADASRLVISYLIDDFRPRFRFDREAARELIDYGKWITGNSMLTFLSTEGDDVFVGWLLGPAALGLYQYAYRFSNAPATEYAQVISRVMFPAFSKIQGDVDQLREVFLTTLRLTALVSMPACFGIAAIAPSFVRAFLGPEWTDMILAMQILAVYGMFRSVAKTFGPLWKAIGHPDYVTKLSALRVGLLAVIIYPLSTEFGLAGTALAVTSLYVFPMMPLDLYITSRAIEASYGEIVHELTYPFIASVVMFVGVWALHLSLDVDPLIEFALLPVVGVVLYVVSVLVLELQFDWGIRENILTAISNVRS